MLYCMIRITINFTTAIAHNWRRFMLYYVILSITEIVVEAVWLGDRNREKWVVDTCRN